MTTVAPSFPATIDAVEAANPAPRVLTRLAGRRCPVGAAAFAAGILTSPIATGDDRASYLESLGRDPWPHPAVGRPAALRQPAARRRRPRAAAARPRAAAAGCRR